MQAARSERDDAREKLSELQSTSEKEIDFQKEIEAQRSQGSKLKVMLLNLI